jgi:NaMN:DMB phosphoribosyltransferase
MARKYVGIMIVVHSQPQLSQTWLDQYRHQRPHFVCVLGFTATCRIPNISAAGLTPADRELTALADGEFLSRGIQPSYRYPLPPLIAGASPAIITNSVGLRYPTHHSKQRLTPSTEL